MSIVMSVMAASAARSEDLQERIPMAPGGRLEVDLEAGSIEVETHDEAAVEVDARASGWPDFAFELSHDAGGVRLRGEHRGWLGFGRGRVRVRVRVPKAFDVDLRTAGGRIEVQELQGDVKARTSGGPIEVEEIDGDVELETSGGTIRAQTLVGRVEARTSGGGIHLSEVRGPVDARTSGGDVRLREVDGPVNARTSGGSMEVRFRAAPAGRLESSGGGIEVEWDPAFGARLSARTSGGRVEIDDAFAVQGSVERSKVDALVGGGGEPLDVQTSGGNIRIRAR